jgi:hypothetical protein
MSRATPRRAAGRWIASDSPKQPFFDFNSNPLRRGAYDYVGMIGRAGQGEQAIRGIGSAPAVVGLQAQAIAPDPVTKIWLGELRCLAVS